MLNLEGLIGRKYTCADNSGVIVGGYINTGGYVKIFGLQGTKVEIFYLNDIEVYDVE